MEYLETTITEASDQEINKQKSRLIVEELLQRMHKKADFPTFYQNFVEINNTIKSDHSSASEIANIILKDHALTNKLLKLVNSAFYGQFKAGVNTVSQAVILLGLNQVQMAVASLMFFEQMKNNAHTIELRDASIYSFISGLIARELAEKWRLKQKEEACICSMIHNLGRYVVLFYLPREFEAVKNHMDSEGTDIQSASRKIIGISFEELGIGIAKYWGLPRSIVQSMRGIDLNGRDTVKIDPINKIAYLSNRMCDIAMMQDKKQVEKNLRDIGDYLGLSKESMIDVYNTVWEKLSKYSRILNINLKESTVLIRFVANFVVPDKVVLKDDQNGEINDGFHDIVSSGLTHISKIILEDDYELNAVLSMVLEIMYRSFEFSRVLICISDPQRKAMYARYGLGEDIEPFMKRFYFETNQADDIFNRALKMDEDIYIEDINEPPGDYIFPEWYLQQIDAAEALIYPIIVSGTKVGLFYADRIKRKPKYIQCQLQYMNILRNQAAIAIKQKRR